MNTTAIVFIAIFGVIIVVLISVAVIGSQRDKRKKKRLNNDIFEKEEKAKDSYYKIIIFLNELIIFVENFKEDFESNSSHNKSLGDLNRYSRDTLLKLQESKEFKSLDKSVMEISTEVNSIFNDFFKNKSSKWRELSFFSFNLVEAKAKAYNSSGNYNKYLENIKKSLKIQ